MASQTGLMLLSFDELSRALSIAGDMLRISCCLHRDTNYAPKAFKLALNHWLMYPRKIS